jgi:hypothetical protein
MSEDKSFDYIETSNQQFIAGLICEHLDLQLTRMFVLFSSPGKGKSTFIRKYLSKLFDVHLTIHLNHSIDEKSFYATPDITYDAGQQQLRDKPSDFLKGVLESGESKRKKVLVTVEDLQNGHPFILNNLLSIEGDDPMITVGGKIGTIKVGKSFAVVMTSNENPQGLGMHNALRDRCLFFNLDSSIHSLFRRESILDSLVLRSPRMRHVMEALIDVMLDNILPEFHENLRQWQQLSNSIFICLDKMGMDVYSSVLHSLTLHFNKSMYFLPKTSSESITEAFMDKFIEKKQGMMW